MRHVLLDFEGESLPIDKALFSALPPPILAVVNQFQPTGSVRGRARIERTRTQPTDPPEGKVDIHAYLDLNGAAESPGSACPTPSATSRGT